MSEPEWNLILFDVVWCENDYKLCLYLSSLLYRSATGIRLLATGSAVLSTRAREKLELLIKKINFCANFCACFTSKLLQ